MGDHKLSEESRRALLKVFGTFDKSGNGVLDAGELPKALQLAGICTDEKGLEEIVCMFDTNKDGILQISELVDNWEVLAQHSVNGEELMQAFKCIDKNRDGYIRMPELKAILTRAGEKWQLHEAEKCMNLLMKFDKDQDSKFSYPEFVEMFMKDMYPFKKPPDAGKKDITQDYEKVADTNADGTTLDKNGS